MGSQLCRSVGWRGNRHVSVLRSHRPLQRRRDYVDKAWHGKGVGAALMERILDWVGPGRDVELHVATYNERARRFYKRWGFVETPGSEALSDGLIEGVTMVRSSPDSLD